MTDCQEYAALLSLPHGDTGDATAAAALERHLATCADCRGRRAAYTAMSAVLQRAAMHYAAPPALRARLLLALATEPAAQRPAAQRPVAPPRLPAGARPGPVGRGAWLLAAGGWLSAGGLAGAFAVLMLVGRPPGESPGRAPPVAVAGNDAVYIDNHARALVTNHLIDVVSSDRHTVKPWFRGRIDFSPPVVDLTAQGTTLAGGRLDYVNHRSVAVLVYQRRQHYIDVYVWPEPAPVTAAAADAATSALGYHSVPGRSGGTAFTAVSDLDAGELAEFAHAFAGGLGVQATQRQ